MLDLEADELGRAYVGATRPQTGVRRHFVDKLRKAADSTHTMALSLRSGDSR